MKPWTKGVGNRPPWWGQLKISIIFLEQLRRPSSSLMYQCSVNPVTSFSTIFNSQDKKGIAYINNTNSLHHSKTLQLKTQNAAIEDQSQIQKATHSSIICCHTHQACQFTKFQPDIACRVERRLVTQCTYRFQVNQQQTPCNITSEVFFLSYVHTLKPRANFANDSVSQVMSAKAIITNVTTTPSDTLYQNVY